MSSLVISELEKGIVCVEYPMHVALSITLLEEEADALKRLGTEPICYLVKLRGVSYVDREITGFIQTHYTQSNFKAVAILFNSDYGYYEHGKMLIDAFLHVSSLGFPVRKFEDEVEAIDWLTSHL